MDDLATLDYSLGELRAVVASLGDAEMDIVSNCEPWTVRRLASHALNNQLRWAGLVTGQELVSVDDAMGAVPIDGDLAPVADQIVESTMALWRTDGVMDAMHSTPFGELPGVVVINFATVDAIIHAWDLSASRRPRDRVQPGCGNGHHLRGGHDLHRRCPGSRPDPAGDRAAS